MHFVGSLKRAFEEIYYLTCYFVVLKFFVCVKLLKVEMTYVVIDSSPFHLKSAFDGI